MDARRASHSRMRMAAKCGLLLLLASVILHSPAVAAPKIAVSPDSLPLIEIPRTVVLLVISISNLADTGSTLLEWSIHDAAPGGDVDYSWVTESPQSGTVPPGGTSNVTVLLDASRVAGGAYRIELRIDSNDPLHPRIVVPLTVEVVVPTPVRRLTLGQLRRQYR